MQLVLPRVGVVKLDMQVLTATIEAQSIIFTPNFFPINFKSDGNICYMLTHNMVAASLLVLVHKIRGLFDCGTMSLFNEKSSGQPCAVDALV